MVLNALPRPVNVFYLSIIILLRIFNNSMEIVRIDVFVQMSCLSLTSINVLAEICIIIIYFVSTCVCMLSCMHVPQPSMEFRGLHVGVSSSLYPMGAELRLSGVVASAFTH